LHFIWLSLNDACKQLTWSVLKNKHVYTGLERCDHSDVIPVHMSQVRSAFGENGVSVCCTVNLTLRNVYHIVMNINKGVFARTHKDVSTGCPQWEPVHVSGLNQVKK
jgi:hypothetical protein